MDQKHNIDEEDDDVEEQNQKHKNKIK